MGHEPHFDLLAAYAEDRLDAPDRTQIEDHLAGCATCRGTVALMARGAVIARFAAPAGAARRLAPWLSVAAAIVIGTLTLVMVELRPGAPPQETSSPATPQPSETAPAPAPPEQVRPAPPSGELQPDRRGAPPAPRRSGAIRRVQGKTFQLVAGEWIDSAFDPDALLPEVRVASPDARHELLVQIPALEPYARLGDRVIVVYQGTVYRIGTPQP